MGSSHLVLPNSPGYPPHGHTNVKAFGEHIDQTIVHATSEILVRLLCEILLSQLSLLYLKNYEQEQTFCVSYLEMLQGVLSILSNFTLWSKAQPCD